MSLLEGCGSRYAPVAPLRSFQEVLALEKPFAFIGKPCDVNALCNLAQLDERVDRLCLFKLTISCGSYADPPSYEAILRQSGIKADEVEAFRYRGHGCPGWSPYARAKNGREVKTDYVDFYYKDIGLRHTYQWRCKTCPDFLGYQADVTILDAWPGGPPEHHEKVTDERKHERDGWILAVARTARGEALLDSASQADALALSPADTADFLHSQPHQITRAVGLWSRRLAHTMRGLPQPRLSQARRELMYTAALHPASLAAATSGAGVTMGSATGSRAVVGNDEAEQEVAVVRTGLGALAERENVEVTETMVQFHVANLRGALMRLKRGDYAIDPLLESE